MNQGCDFIFGASSIKSLPDESVTEIAFAGRSNVGKSSLINLLSNNKRIARVSSKPGCTRQINFYSICHNKFRLVDLPGYGYSRASKEATFQYLHLVEHYLIQRKNLQKVFVLIDSRLGLKEIDKDFIYWLTCSSSVKFSIVLTKIDKANQKGLDIIQENIKKWTNDKSILVDQITMVSIRTACELKNLKNEILESVQSC